MARMTILCGGGSRSGSTWQYNAVRAILSVKGFQVYGAWIADYDPARPEPCHVVKAHDRAASRRFPEARAVGCYRDLRDVAQSLARIGWLQPRRARRFRNLVASITGLGRYAIVRRALDDYLANEAAWRARAAYMMRYEDMVAEPAGEVTRLGSAIGQDLGPAEIAEVLARIEAARPSSDVPTGTDRDYDRETLLHPGHLGRGEAAPDPALRAYVERRYAAWLRARGYSTVCASV